MQDLDGALRIYALASEYVHSSGFHEEVEWQRRTELNEITEQALLRESAWVILCSGFRESTVSRLFDHISLCFCDWEAAAAIVDTYPACYFAARTVFGHVAKLTAIVSVAKYIHETGFDSVKASIMSDPICTLRQLPFIGPVTVWHLAKNIGCNVAKPDRHMVRVSQSLGFDSHSDFCDAISECSGEPVKVVDLIVWRYLADNAAYVVAGDG